MDKFHTVTWNDRCIIEMAPCGPLDEKPLIFMADVVHGRLKVGDALDRIGTVEKMEINHKPVEEVESGDPSVVITMSI